ncbi:MAG TPA: 1-(5-phosphoribosyl)-5-[(5-phosphoribosylamino)methylideneamino]imidazole-4-carboxamide isomerase [Dehalococcoidia bacterium]|nr:1-(5-phosphoribosyl)-5-[(5-phosphoribosylamino)methylideneamino]imidazole-4-carboxamide isomerase [Dehalococcoidia bacterium]
MNAVSFDVIPALDLRGGRCVRLYQGNYERETVYDEDPLGVARKWEAMGAGRLHVVDLDGARDGEQRNAAAVASILASTSLRVELGGGIRDLSTIERWLNLGVDRVFLGTAAVTDPALLRAACAEHPGRVAVGADARNGRIAVRGWEEDSGEGLIDFARRALDAGACAVAYTDVSRDGTLAGPNFAELRALIAALPPHDAQIILAGGVASMEDVRAACSISGLDAVIIGRALYEGRLDLREALAVAAMTRG